jgi:hypothetical protein
VKFALTPDFFQDLIRFQKKGNDVEIVYLVVFIRIFCICSKNKTVKKVYPELADDAFFQEICKQVSKLCDARTAQKVSQGEQEGFWWWTVVRGQGFFWIRGLSDAE